MAESGDYAVIIISLSLEETDGLRVASQLRSRPATRMVPILVLI